jgi:UDP-glucose 4-epimerase
VSDDARATTGVLSSGDAPRRVAVLGGTGLIGAAVVREFLDARWEVTVLARHEPDAHRADALKGAEVVIGDALSPTVLHDTLDGVHHVVDALGAPHPAASARAPVAQFDAEVPSVLAVLDELRQRPGVGLTYFSSGGAIYGNAEVLPVPEGAECNPISPYGVTKLAAERYVLMASERDGVPVRVLRVANAYGSLQRPRTGQGLIATLLHGAATGTPVQVFGDGSTVRDYVDARDVALATVQLATNDTRELVVNVGSGCGHTVDDVLAIAEKVTHASIEVHRLEARATDVRAVVLDVRQLSTLLDWQPRSLEGGVADVWAQWTDWDRAEHVATSEVT